MDLGDAVETERVTDLRTACDTLRPAVVLWLVLCALVGVNALGWAYLSARQPPPELVLLLLFELTSVVMAVVAFVFARRDRSACRVFARPRRGMLELCLVAGIAGTLLLATWERSIPSAGAASPSVYEQSAGVPLVLSLLTTALMPAVFEEIAFRGVVLQRLRRVLPDRLAIATQAMMFSVLHMDMVYLLPHFAFGCLAGFLRLAARALWPCMLMHLLWNGWLVLDAYGIW